MKGSFRRASVRGAICGILAAFCYGTNPIGAVPLYRAGVPTETIILYRTGFAVPIVAAFLFLTGGSFRLARQAVGVTAALGALFAVSSLSFYAGMRLLDVGTACTLLFVYPILTAAIMILFFGERLRARTGVAMALAFGGTAALCLGGGGRVAMCAVGIGVTLLSALTYALYIVIVQRADLRLPVGTMTFWVLFFCALTLLGWTAVVKGPTAFILPSGAVQWGSALFIAIVPTLLSLAFLARGVRLLGSTPTSVLGALEPLTAVAIGVLVFGEPFTANLAVGLLCILSAVLLVLLPASGGASDA